MVMTPKEKAKAARLKRVYGITTEQYQRALEIQGGACVICLRRPPDVILCVDHEHIRKNNKTDTGRVRGLLCQYCNHRRVGRARSVDASLYFRIANYLATDFDIRKL